MANARVGEKEYFRLRNTNWTRQGFAVTLQQAF